MSDDPTDLVLEPLRAIRSDLSDVRETLREHGHRVNRIELGLAGLRRDQALDAEQSAHVEARLDRLGERIGRIEERLDLKDA